MLSEWMAYERFAGPIDDRWRDEVLASLQEAVQVNGQLIGMSIPKKKGKKNPAPKFRKVPRPTEIFRQDEEDEPEDDEEE